MCTVNTQANSLYGIKKPYVKMNTIYIYIYLSIYLYISISISISICIYIYIYIYIYTDINLLMKQKSVSWIQPTYNCKFTINWLPLCVRIPVWFSHYFLTFWMNTGGRTLLVFIYSVNAETIWAMKMLWTQ